MRKITEARETVISSFVVIKFVDPRRVFVSSEQFPLKEKKKKGKSPLAWTYDVERLKFFEATLASAKVFRCRKYLAQTYQSSARQKYARSTAPTEHKTVGLSPWKMSDTGHDATLNR